MNNIRMARKQVGMTAKQLGEAVGVTDAAISQYENEKRQPSFEVLLKMCEVLGCSSDYLLRGEGNKRPHYKKEKNPTRPSKTESQVGQADRPVS